MRLKAALAKKKKIDSGSTPSTPITTTDLQEAQAAMTSKNAADAANLQADKMASLRISQAEETKEDSSRGAAAAETGQSVQKDD